MNALCTTEVPLSKAFWTKKVSPWCHYQISRFQPMVFAYKSHDLIWRRGRELHYLSGGSPLFGVCSE